MRTTKKWVSAIAVAVMALGLGGFVATTAQATVEEWNAENGCLISPAVEEVGHWDVIPPVMRTVPAVWQNFSPNEDQGPLVGQPAHPTDSRGTWQHQDKEIPPGQEGPDGVYQNGEGNGSWFYRAEAYEVIAVEEKTVWVVDVEAKDAVYGPCEPDVYPVPALFNADPTPADCGVAGAFSTAFLGAES